MAYFYRFEYDMVIAFSAPDRSTAEEFARKLAERNITVSMDEYKAADESSMEPDARLTETLGRKARFYLLLISESFPTMNWKNIEQIADTEKRLSIIPVRLDDTEVQGLEAASETRDLRRQSMQDIIDLVTDTIIREKSHPGPPSQSHDLRSGNVPSTKDRNEP